MMHRVWSSIEEATYCFLRSYVKLQGHTALKIVDFDPNLGVSGLYLQFGITDAYELMHKAWSSVEEVSYCFSRSSVKFQGHTALKIVEFDPNWAFPDCNSSLNSPMAMKCCTKLEISKERCLIVFQGHPSNFKVTRDKTSPILTQIGRFRTIGRSQLSNPSDLPLQGHTSNSKVTWLKKSSNLTQIGRFRTVSSVWISWWIWNDTQIKAWCSIKDVPYYFSGSSIKFQGHTGEKLTIWIQFE